MEKLRPISFPSAGSHPVQLEGMLHFFDGQGQWPACVVCHPHPLAGGTMHNNVVTAMTRALAVRGVMVLRFNFRGVGGSSGQHDHGRGEQADVAGALDWLLDQPQVDPWRVSLAGYSFGAWIALRYAQTDVRVAAVAAVGLVAEQCEAGSMQSFTGPRLFVTGEQDSLAPPQPLCRLVEQLPPPKNTAPGPRR